MKAVLALTVVYACACLGVSGAPQDKKQGDGGWRVEADKNRGGGTVVRAEADKKWDVSKDGKVQAEVHGHWEREYGGPRDGNRDHGVGGSIGGGWGK